MSPRLGSPILCCFYYLLKICSLSLVNNSSFYILYLLSSRRFQLSFSDMPCSLFLWNNLCEPQVHPSLYQYQIIIPSQDRNLFYPSETLSHRRLKKLMKDLSAVGTGLNSESIGWTSTSTTWPLLSAITSLLQPRLALERANSRTDGFRSCFLFSCSQTPLFCLDSITDFIYLHLISMFHGLVMKRGEAKYEWWKDGTKEDYIYTF